MNMSCPELCCRRQAACSAASRFALEFGFGAEPKLRGIGKRIYQTPWEVLQQICGARKEESLSLLWIRAFLPSQIYRWGVAPKVRFNLLIWSTL
mmetsp:Transcript_59260/g.95848  ORF Transcript_59260/g.95848 Transcript_59260/m.95848 type:complete len:94 (-) Transcript_59260:271-552(-)